MDNAGETVEHPNRRSRRLRRRSLAVLSVLALAVAACGGDDDDGGDDASADDTEATGGDSEDLLGPEDVAEGDPIKIGMVGDGVTEAFDNTDELLAAEAAGEYWRLQE
jgi:hypothetical protein